MLFTYIRKTRRLDFLKMVFGLTFLKKLKNKINIKILITIVR